MRLRWIIPATFIQTTFLVLPLQVQRGPVVVGGAGLGGEVPAALGVGSHHVGVRRQSWRQRGVGGVCFFCFVNESPYVPVSGLARSLTVAPESLRLGFYILEVGVKVLPWGGSGTKRAELRARLLAQPTAVPPSGWERAELCVARWVNRTFSSRFW